MFSRKNKAEESEQVAPDRYVFRSGTLSRYQVRDRVMGGGDHPGYTTWSVYDTDKGEFTNDTGNRADMIGKANALNAGQPYIFDTQTGERKPWNGSSSDGKLHVEHLNRVAGQPLYREAAVAVVRAQLARFPGIWEVRDDADAVRVTDPLGQEVAICATREEAEFIRRLAYEVLATPGAMTPKLRPAG